MSPDEFIDHYYDCIHGAFANLNLTALKTKDEMKEKLFFDSINPWMEFKELEELLLKTGKVFDIGTGGGFPILPMASKYTKVQFFGVDARAKKIKAVEEIAKKMNLKNVCVEHARGEDFYLDCPIIILFRAVSSVANCLKLASQIGHKEVNIIIYKGPNWREEDDLEGSFEKYQMNLENVFIHDSSFQSLPFSREYLWIKPKNVPRGTMKKKLRKISDCF